MIIKSIINNTRFDRSRCAHASLHDPLTGLANRTLFQRRADEAITFAAQENGIVAIIYIDLDDFKEVNDNYGHQAGDELLAVISGRIRSVVRSSDTAARLGGDEFAIVLHGVNDRGAVVKICDKLSRVLMQPADIGHSTLQVSGSIGVAITPDHGDNIDSLMCHADKDMYHAKNMRKSS